MDQQLLRQWLKAGFLEKHAWFATTEGTPQGGIASPALANWTLVVRFTNNVAVTADFL